jgi:primosomal protein N' (replication factor Y)
VLPIARLKPVTRLIDTVPPLAESFRKWIDAVSDLTLAPKGMVLSLCGFAHAARKTRTAFTRQAFDFRLPSLSQGQQQVLTEFTGYVTRDQASIDTKPKPMLLDGVTGSGKTEVYFHAIADVLANNDASGTNAQVLVLLPEISLTHQWLERFERTFGTQPVVWHSRLTPAAKARAWQAIAKNEAQVVVGARSALFLPFNNLKIMIVDEEHDPSYKQDDGVLYHARDMAVLRAYHARVPLVLVSATPSLETLENVQEGKYRTLHLTSRYGSAGLPEVNLVDLRHAPPSGVNFSRPR